MTIPFHGYDLNPRIFKTGVDGLSSRGHDGVFSVTIPPERVSDQLKRDIGRERVALKIFHKTDCPLAGAKWRHQPLVEATMIQNLCALEGISPRVYGLAQVDFRGHKYWAQITDWAYDLEPKEPSRALGNCRALFRLHWQADMNPKNWPNGWFVDFQTVGFAAFDAYREDLMKRAYRRAAWGSSKRIYQDIPQWGIIGQRNLSRRIRQLRLDDIRWRDKRVLDAGCNIGTMSRFASAQGASRVLGLDTPACARMASEFSILLGYWNLDFLGGNWRRPALDREFNFDVVFFLSQYAHFGFPDWAHEACDDVLFFEGHVPSHEHTFRDMLEEHFGEVEFLGMSRDHGPRPTFRCWKGIDGPDTL